VIIAADPKIELGQDRTLSMTQLRDDLTSIFSVAPTSSLQGTKDFRLAWWSYIVSYTVDGPYFWTGKGFGVNLADDDHFQVTADDSLRSPHNSHMTVLARMGVPGLVLWIAIQSAFGLALVRTILRLRGQSSEDRRWAAILTWILIYWTAMLVDTSFDPYLEGPQGGIWFWAVIGMGLAALRCQAARTVSAVSARPSRALVRV
jgi:O-antigen ligase